MGTIASRPWAFLTVILYGLLWLAIEPDTLDLHGLATLVVWVMTLFIQRSEHRDTQAIHAKLDELLHAQSNAESHVSKIDEAEPEEIEGYREDHNVGV